MNVSIGFILNIGCIFILTLDAASKTIISCFELIVLQVNSITVQKKTEIYREYPRIKFLYRVLLSKNIFRNARNNELNRRFKENFNVFYQNLVRW